MPSTCSSSRVDAPRSLFALVLLGLAAAPCALAADTATCALATPKVQAAAAIRFEITLDCTAQAQAWAAKPFPVGGDVVVGLTVYAGPKVQSALRNDSANFQRRELDATREVRSALERKTRSTAVLVGTSPKWIVLSDDAAASHDVTPKKVRIERAGWSTTLQFDVDPKAISGKDHFVFAAWPAAALIACDKKSSYARSGCKRDGQVIDTGDGVNPLASYPGLEINHFEHPSGESWSSERWIVERFR
jgi:hypothetical protein